MPAVTVKYAGAWRPAVAAGKLAIKRSGAWYYPTTLKVKRGAQGGGDWYDSGYQSFPGTPGTPAVYGWDYYNLHVLWEAPPDGVGAPVASYEVQLLNEGGGLVSGPAAQTNRDYYFGGLGAQTRYRVRVRAKSASGLYSAWSGELRVQMGRASYTIPRSEYRTRPWYAATWHPDVAYGGMLLQYCPWSVASWQLQLNVATNPSTNPFCGGGATVRRAHFIANSADTGDCGLKNNPWDEAFVWYATENTQNGILLTTTGAPGWNSIHGYGTVHLWGNETYIYYWDEVVPAISNGYW